MGEGGDHGARDEDDDGRGHIYGAVGEGQGERRKEEEKRCINLFSMFTTGAKGQRLDKFSFRDSNYAAELWKR